MNFEYKGRDSNGELTNGALIAESRQEALRELKRRGIVPLDLKEAKSLDKEIRFKKKLKTKDFVMFLRQYATLIDAGVSIVEATETMAKQTSNEGLRVALYDIHRQVERGESLSVASSRYPKIFPELLVNMIYAGEKSGRLDDILDDMATYYEKQHKNRQTLKSSMMYPIAVGVVALMLMTFLLTYIVPTFADMFMTFDSEIPAYTLFIMGVSDFIRSYWYIVIIGIALSVIVVSRLLKIDKINYKSHEWLLKIPLIGQLFHMSALMRMSQTMGILLNASIPIIQVLEITERVMDNRIFKNSIRETREMLTTGGEMSTVFDKHWEYPPIFTQMVQVGEKTGRLDYMLEKLSGFYEDEVDELSSRFGALIEPIMIVGLAVVVGSIVLAIIIPMFALYESF